MRSLTAPQGRPALPGMVRPCPPSKPDPTGRLRLRCICGSRANRYLPASVPSRRGPFSRVTGTHFRESRRESAAPAHQMRVLYLLPRNPVAPRGMPLLGLPLPSGSPAIYGHSSGVRSENRAVIVGARAAAHRPLPVGDSQATHESRRRARRLPAAPASTASGTFPSASDDRCSPCSTE